MTLDSRRALIWQAMRLGPLWQQRQPGAVAGGTGAAGDSARIASDLARPAALSALPHEMTPEAQAASSAAKATPTSGHAKNAALSSSEAATLDVDRMQWPALRAAVTSCMACGLCKSRRQTVFGVGHEAAEWMLVGEAPGAEEDARGEPFVGQAGRLLDNMLETIGLSRTAENPQRAVYIVNVLKCRPPGNRNPEPDEVAHCEPYLRRQVALVRPRILLVMGRFAAQSLLGTDASIASLRGRVHHIEVDGRCIPVVVTYHPAYLLRNLADKSKSWADLCLARDTLTRGAD